MEETLENPEIYGCRRCKALISRLNLSGERIELGTNIFVFSGVALWATFLFLFGGIMEKLLEIVRTVNSYTADYVLVILLIGMGVFFTVATRFVQVRCFGEGMKRVFGNFSLRGGKQKGGMSSFQALATAIAAQVGTGNIVGASGAILAGGPGAIFWMWVIAFFGMATIYAEAVLAQETRSVDSEGNVHGGPVYYIKTAFKGTFGKILAGIFAVTATLALGFMGGMVQSNSMSEAFANALNISPWIVGIVVAVLCVLIFIGGTSRIASVTEKMVPSMALLFIAGSLVIIVSRISYIPETFSLIFKYAFDPRAIIGGGIGTALKTAISQGAKRGLFSNEAGMGSTPHAHALAKVEKPHDQGVVAMIGVFIDTFIVLTITALVVISTLYVGDGILADGVEAGVNKGNMAQIAFGQLFGENLGNIFVAVCLVFFAFSTIISWSLFGKINFMYLFKKKGLIVYSVISVGFVFLGSLLSNDLVWELTDMFNYLMVIPNAIAVFALWKIVARAAKKQKK